MAALIHAHYSHKRLFCLNFVQTIFLCLNRQVVSWNIGLSISFNSLFVVCLWLGFGLGYLCSSLKLRSPVHLTLHVLLFGPDDCGYLSLATFTRHIFALVNSCFQLLCSYFDHSSYMFFDVGQNLMAVPFFCL